MKKGQETSAVKTAPALAFSISRMASG